MQKEWSLDPGGKLTLKLQSGLESSELCGLCGCNDLFAHQPQSCRGSSLHLNGTSV